MSGLIISTDYFSVSKLTKAPYIYCQLMLLIKKKHNLSPHTSKFIHENTHYYT